MKTAGKLQADNNKLQQEMIEMIKTNNEITAKHNTTIRRLKWALVALTLIAVLASVVSVIITVKMLR